MYKSYVIANIAKTHPYFNKLDEFAFECKNVYNSTLYQYRQNYFNNLELISAFDMISLLKNMKTVIPTKVKQQIIKQVYETIKAFYVSASKLPRYLDSKYGRANIILTNQSILKLSFKKENKIAFNYQNDTFEFGIANLVHKKQISFKDIQQVKIVYQHHKYLVILIVKEPQSSKTVIQTENVLAVDLGLNNIMATVLQNQRILFDGKPLKKINHRFNKQLAKLQSKRDNKKNKLAQVENQIDHMMTDVIFFYELNSRHDFNEQKYKKLLRKQTHLTNEISKLNLRISRLYEKRSNRIQYCLHKLSRELVELTVSNRISKIVIGYNEQWKQAINLGHVNNQNFVQIPFKTLIRYIQYKSDVEVVLQEESYTSKCSFLDNENVCKHTEYLGKRVKRGLFRSHTGQEIHADINAAYNIAKKAGYDFGSYPISPCSWAVVKRIRFN